MTSTPTAILPYLTVDDGPAAIDFYRAAFGAELDYELTMDDGRLGHAEMTLGERRFMLSGEFAEVDCLGPKARGGSSVSLAFYVDDVDAMAERATRAGATLERPIKDEFYGDRVAHLRDPFGHKWTLHQRLEDLSADEIKRRMAAL